MKILIISNAFSSCGLHNLEPGETYNSCHPPKGEKYKDNEAGVWVIDSAREAVFLPCAISKKILEYEIIEP